MHSFESNAAIQHGKKEEEERRRRILFFVWPKY
jgi:hypothetical protein